MAKAGLVPLLFKVLVDGRSCHGGDYKYPVGRWTVHVDSLNCCSRGYHLTTDPLRWWIPRAELFLAVPDTSPVGDNTDKAAFHRVKLVQRVTKDWEYLCMFSRVRAFLAASARSFNKSADITWANLSWANLSGAHLSGADLSEANLSEANLSKANLYGANLSRANLSEANLSKANLSGAHLSGAHLSGANLSWANLSWANLSEANLSGANLSGAHLSGAVAGSAIDGWHIKDGRYERD